MTIQYVGVDIFIDHNLPSVPFTYLSHCMHMDSYVTQSIIIYHYRLFNVKTVADFTSGGLLFKLDFLCPFDTFYYFIGER